MVSQIGLREAFRDTQIQIQSNTKLREETRKMQAGTRLYLDHFESVIGERKCVEPHILIEEDTTFHCAQKFVSDGKKTAVLNFANAYRPGGGVVDGAMAQEECLCRSSNLYEALTISYMIRHYYKWNEKNTGDMSSDRIIYSPDVTVFKSDDTYPVNLEKWFHVDVITCAAPYFDKQKKKPVTLDKLTDVFENRIRNILEVAIANQVDYLILGAFGCGAFHNPPELVASVFYKLLVEQGYGRYFEQVVFAIKKSKEVCPNLEVFKQMFHLTGGL